MTRNLASVAVAVAGAIAVAVAGVAAATVWHAVAGSTLASALGG